MAISGNIYVYNTGGYLYVKAENCGEAATLTHNIFGSLQEAKTTVVHDDHMGGAIRGGGGALDQTGTGVIGGGSQHGVPIPQGTADAPQAGGYRMRIGENYRQTPIKPGAFIRVGFRYIAHGAVEIPPEGEVKILSYADLTYEQRGTNTENQRGPKVPPSLTGSFVDDVATLMMAAKRGVMVHGEMRIVPTAHPDRPNELLGWEVWFDNNAPALRPDSKMKTGFAATIVMTNADGEGEKNAGLGLESMACPEGGTAAMQFIRAGGDYGRKEFGVEAQPGQTFRAGIRAHSSFVGRLPALDEGPLTMSLTKFTKEDGDVDNDAFFDKDELTKKMGEKKNRVKFFVQGVSINHELPDTIYEGALADQHADYPPPRLAVEWVEDDKKYKGGGWKVSMTNCLPADPEDPSGETCGDDLGKLAFTGTLKLVDGDVEGKDLRKLKTQTFDRPGQTNEWFIPAGTEVAGLRAQAGRTLQVGTRGTGWLANVELPAVGEKIDTGESDAVRHETWSLWETQHERAMLYPPED